MTAISVIRQRNAVHLLTDGANVDPVDGILLFAASKAFAIPNINAAIAVRGDRRTTWVVAEGLGNVASSFDELKARIATLLREFFATKAEFWRKAFGPESMVFELVVCGVGKDGPDSYFVPTHDAPGVFSAFDVIPLDPVAMMPGTFEMIVNVQRGRSADELDPVRDGLALIEAQRAYRVPGGPNTLACNVGCFVQLTTVTADAITTKIIHRWPDVIGKKLKEVAP